MWVSNALFLNTNPNFNTQPYTLALILYPITNPNPNSNPKP